MRHPIYDALMDLVSKNEAFYYQDFTLDGKVYRVFNYRLASYTDFLADFALEARGITFEVSCENRDAVCYRLVCRPMQKFFNLNEVSSDVNTLAEDLVRSGRLSQDVYDRVKNRNKK